MRTHVHILPSYCALPSHLLRLRPALSPAAPVPCPLTRCAWVNPALRQGSLYAACEDCCRPSCCLLACPCRVPARAPHGRMMPQRGSLPSGRTRHGATCLNSSHLPVAELRLLGGAQSQRLEQKLYRKFERRVRGQAGSQKCRDDQGCSSPSRPVLLTFGSRPAAPLPLLLIIQLLQLLSLLLLQLLCSRCPCCCCC